MRWVYVAFLQSKSKVLGVIIILVVAIKGVVWHHNYVDPLAKVWSTPNQSLRVHL